MGRFVTELRFSLLILSLLALTTACMPKVEEEEVTPVVKITSHALNGSSASQMKITLVGSCPVSTYVLRVIVDATEFSVGQTSASAVANSGIPVGTCNKGALSIVYPVPNPKSKRTISFKVKARLSDGRSSVEWAIRDVNYVPPLADTAGFAILAVGGVSTGTGVMMHGSGGEPYGGDDSQVGAPANVLTSAQAMLRTGLQGILQE